MASANTLLETIRVGNRPDSLILRLATSELRDQCAHQGTSTRSGSSHSGPWDRSRYTLRETDQGHQTHVQRMRIGLGKMRTPLELWPHTTLVSTLSYSTRQGTTASINNLGRLQIEQSWRRAAGNRRTAKEDSNREMDVTDPGPPREVSKRNQRGPAWESTRMARVETIWPLVKSYQGTPDIQPLEGIPIAPVRVRRGFGAHLLHAFCTTTGGQSKAWLQSSPGVFNSSVHQNMQWLKMTRASLRHFELGNNVGIKRPWFAQPSSLQDLDRAVAHTKLFFGTEPWLTQKTKLFQEKIILIDRGLAHPRILWYTKTDARSG